MASASAAKKLLIGEQNRNGQSAHETIGAWREGQHDDLVLAIACAAWVAENAPQGEIKLWIGPRDCVTS